MEKEFAVSQRERDLLIMAYKKWEHIGPPYSRPEFAGWVRSVTKPSIFITPITAEEFQEATGHAPVDDDLERCNCPDTGTVGHQSCGWNEKKQLPNYMCI